MEDRLIIGYDKSDGKDHTCLTVGRQAPGTRGMMILNQYFDKEAEEMYKKLTNKEERTSMNKIERFGKKNYYKVNKVCVRLYENIIDYLFDKAYELMTWTDIEKTMSRGVIRRLKYERNTKGKKINQRTFCYCSGCQNELTSSNSFIKDTDFVYYKCSDCGEESEWDFDAPVPILLSEKQS